VKDIGNQSLAYIEKAPDVFFVYHLEGRNLLFVNEQTTIYPGCEREELLKVKVRVWGLSFE